LTGPSDPTPPAGRPADLPQPIDEPAPDEPSPGEPSAEEPARPGLRTFSLEGRRAPGLYLVGWLGTVLGGPLLGAAFLVRPGGAGGLVLGVLGSVLLAVGLIAAAGAQAIERRDRADLAYRGPWPLLVFAASVPLLVILGLPFAILGLKADSPVATLLSVSLTCLTWLILIGLTVVGPGALRWREIGPGLADAPLSRIVGDLLVGAAAAFPVLLATIVVTVLLVSIIGATPAAPIAIPADRAGLAISLIAAAVVAPISEEIFWRGFATTAWVRARGPTAAIVLGGLAFAFVHVLPLSGSAFDPAIRAAIVGFLARVPVALALGWIFVRRRSLPASIGLHATFNAVLVLVAASTVAPS
jgi:membrane protease YdiL (CAAX protease family)